MNGYTTTTVYFNGDNLISEDEFHALYENQEAKPDVAWVDLSGE